MDAKYSGIVFDIEVADGDGPPLIDAFQSLFQECKHLNLEVGITMSHSAPFETDTPEIAANLVKSWTQDKNVDFISPQLYSSG